MIQGYMFIICQTNRQLPSDFSGTPIQSVKKMEKVGDGGQQWVALGTFQSFKKVLLRAADLSKLQLHQNFFCKTD